MSNRKYNDLPEQLLKILRQGKVANTKVFNCLKMSELYNLIDSAKYQKKILFKEKNVIK